MAYDTRRHLDPVVASAYDSSTAAEFDPAVIGAAVDLLARLAGGAGSNEPTAWS